MGIHWTKTRVLALAAAVGLITGLLFYRVYIGGNEHPKTPTAVAQVAIPENAIVKPEMVKMEPRDLASEAPGLQKGRGPVELADVVGKVATAGIDKDAEIVPSRLRPARFSDTVPKDMNDKNKYMRAVSVAVDAVISVGGFVNPGDHVDVVATYDRGDQPSTQTILQDVELLAVGPDVQSPKGKTEGDTAQPDRKTAVLSVYPGQAQLLALWENHGKLRLVLRNPNDSKIVKVDPTEPLWGRNNPPPPAPPIGPKAGQPGQAAHVTVKETKPGPPQPTIEVIRGNVKTQEVVAKG